MAKKKVFVVQNGQVVEKPKRVLRAVPNAVSSESETINAKNKKESMQDMAPVGRHIPAKSATETWTAQPTPWVRPPDVDPTIVYKQDDRVQLIIPLLKAHQFEYMFHDTDHVPKML